MLNSVVLAGNLGNDPDIHFNSEGEPICSFNLAFRASKQKTGWIRVTAFSKLAEICEKHLHKGAKIAVSGVLDYSQWENNEGVKKSAIQMSLPVREHRYAFAFWCSVRLEWLPLGQEA